MYKLILILLATAGSPHDVSLTWEITGFGEYADCLTVGTIIAEEYLMQGFDIGDMTCEPYE